MARRNKVYEGKAKILYEGPEPGTLVAHFKDDVTAFNNQKHDTLQGKGVLNNRISEYIMTHLTRVGVPTHFIRRLNMREQLIRKVDIIPLEVVCRRVVAGSLAKRLGLKEGEHLPRPLVELYYKDDDLGDPMVSEDHVVVFDWASSDELDDMIAMSLRVHDFLSGLFAAVGILLVDFKLEFGRLYTDEGTELMLADEISPDSCRLWDMETHKILDKDRFRRDLGEVTQAYTEVARRLGLMKE